MHSPAIEASPLDVGDQELQKLSLSQQEGGGKRGKRGSIIERRESGNPTSTDKMEVHKSPQGRRTSIASLRKHGRDSSSLPPVQKTDKSRGAGEEDGLSSGHPRGADRPKKTVQKPPPTADGAALLTASRGKHTFALEQGGLMLYEFAAVMQEDARRQDHLAELIGEMLEETVARNDARGRKGVLTSFEGSKKAPIAPSAYIRRIMKYGDCSPCCLAVGVLYLERLKRRHNGLCLTSYNFQRLFLLAVMQAAKYLDDVYFSNKHWAEVGGFSLQEMNSLELEFLFRINFFLSVQREDYDSFVAQLIGTVEE